VTRHDPGATGGWLPLALTLMIQSMVAMAQITVPVMAPQVAAGLGVSPALVGVYVSIAYVGATIASLTGGVAVTRWGAIRVSQCGLVICALGLSLCASGWLPMLALGALMVGFGYGPITPASSHVLARTTPAHRMSLVFSVKQTGVPAGFMLGGAIVPSLTLMAGWQASLLVVAAVSVLCAVLSQPLQSVFDVDRNPAQAIRLSSLLQPIRLVLSHRSLATMAACSFMFCIVQMSLTTYLVTFLHTELAYGLVAAGLVLSFSQMGGVAGRILWGYVADRGLGAFRTLVMLAGLMALCALATATFTPQVPRAVVIAVLVVFGASAIGWNGVYLAEVARRAPPGQASLATGGTLAFTFLGGLVGPSVFGGLSSLLGTYRAGYAALMVIATASGSLLLWNHLRGR
jgi:predicted MFS family arabinose efflux permease